MDDPSEALVHVASSISSGNDYKLNSHLVFEALAQKSKAYTDNFLKVLAEIFPSTEYPPTSKFYALYLLAKATEQKDEFLATRLTRHRPLLDKLFKDSQTDGGKPFEEKGKKFFSKTPTAEDSIIGNHFIRLILEALVFWRQNYGSEDKKSPLHIYFVMHTTLAPRIKFPEELIYFTKSYTITNDFHLQPPAALPKLEIPTNLEAGSAGQQHDALTEVENDEIYRELYLAVSSGSDYQAHSPKVFEHIKRNSRKHNATILAGITEILRGDDYSPTLKFYALLLLTQLTESKNQVFIQQIADEKDLLEWLGTYALIDKEMPRQERGKTLFTDIPNSPEATIGANYCTLVLEAVQYWAQTFPSATKNDALSRFGSMYTSLKERGVEFSQQNVYIGKPLHFEEDEMNRSLSKRETYSPEKKKHTPTASSPDNLQPEARDHVRASITSGRDYKRNSPKVFDAIKKNSKEYTIAYLRTTGEILKSKEVPVNQFYALYLLLKLSETKNETLSSELPNHQDILNELFQQAQTDRQKDVKERGKTFFTKTPTSDEATIGQNYITLLLETFCYIETSK